ncbi:four helix bundle protein [Saccharospirillum alexandrii]
MSYELRTQIHIGAKIQYIDAKTSEHWLNETNEISAMIKGLDKAIS